MDTSHPGPAPAAPSAVRPWPAVACCAAVALLAVLLIAGPLGAARSPAAPAERVSPADGLSHIRPAVAANAAGAVVVWQGESGSPPSYEIFARRYDAAGAARGPAFRVNEQAAGAQSRPAVALLADGGFVVAWDGPGPSGQARNIYLRRYDAAGAARGPEQAANALLDGNQFAPALATHPAGGFAVAWHGAVPGDARGVALRRYDAAGAPLDAQELPPYPVADAAADQTDASLAYDAAGALTVAWETYRYDEAANRATYTVAARRYGDSAGPITLAAGGDADAPSDPAAAAGPAGSAVVAWVRGSGSVELARLGLGAPAAQTVSGAAPAERGAPALALDADGAGIALWPDATTSSGGVPVGLAARLFAADGGPSGDELYPALPAPYASTSVGVVAAATSPGGELLVVWDNEESLGGAPVGSIYLRRFVADGAATPTPTGQPGATASPTATPTGQPGATATPTGQLGATATPSPTATPTQGPELSPTPPLQLQGKQLYLPLLAN